MNNTPLNILQSGIMYTNCIIELYCKCSSISNTQTLILICNIKKFFVQALIKTKSQYMVVCDFVNIFNVNVLGSDVSKYINERIIMRQAETVRPSHEQNTYVLITHLWTDPCLSIPGNATSAIIFQPALVCSSIVPRSKSRGITSKLKPITCNCCVMDTKWIPWALSLHNSCLWQRGMRAAKQITVEMFSFFIVNNTAISSHSPCFGTRNVIRLVIRQG